MVVPVLTALAELQTAALAGVVAPVEAAGATGGGVHPKALARQELEAERAWLPLVAMVVSVWAPSSLSPPPPRALEPVAELVCVLLMVASDSLLRYQQWHFPASGAGVSGPPDQGSGSGSTYAQAPAGKNDRWRRAPPASHPHACATCPELDLQIRPRVFPANMIIPEINPRQRPTDSYG